MKLRIILTNLVLVIGSVLIVTAATELTLQADRWWQKQRRVHSTVRVDDVRLIWEYIPYTERSYGRSSNNIIGKFNRYGFRDFDRESTTKPEATLRVAFLGDSVTEGFGVSFDDTFVSIFQKLVAKTFDTKRIEALNFGIGGYQSVQIAATLNKVFPYQADIIVYVMCPNDFDFIDASGGLVAYHSPPSLLLPDWIEEKITSLKYPLGDSGYYATHFDMKHEKVFSAIEEMKAKIHQNDAQFVVAVLPHFLDAPVSDKYPFNEHQKTLQYLRDNEIRFVDLLSEIRNAGVNNLADVALDRWHPNPEGHHIIAEILVGRLYPELELRKTQGD